ncbi:MAG TPA: hypothetical protein VK811_01090 [Candidatus Acidoferrum sp.]|jgi:hypothetical protein|nr:hypothetical protein [Candidatus Acidoferrum sp.]
MIGQKTFLSRPASSMGSGTVPFVPFALLVPCRHLIPVHPVHSVHCIFVTFVPFCSKSHSRLPKAIQGYSSPFSPIQGIFKKYFFYPSRKFSVPTLCPHHPMTPKPAHPKRKSMISRPKSTVDLGFEPLIRVENALQTPFLPDYRHSFRPITMLEWRACRPKAGRNRPKTESCPHCSLNEKAGARRQNKINYPPLIYG